MAMSRVLFALPAACMLVVPAKAQAPKQAPGVPAARIAGAAIDPGLVGEWVLATVERHGTIEDFGAEVDDMTCDFGADGSAHVMLEIEQDQDTMTRDRSFHFVTLDGRIVADQGPAVSYEVIDGDEIRLTTPDGLVVHLRRSDDVAQR